MQQSAVSPKISLSIDVKQVLDLVQSLHKDTSSKQHQRLNIDIYLGPTQDAPASTSGPVHEGPVRVNRGAWATVPTPAVPDFESCLRPSSSAPSRAVSPGHLSAPELAPLSMDAGGSASTSATSSLDAAAPDIRSRLSQSFGGAQYTDIAKFAKGVYRDLSLALPGAETEAKWRMLAELWEYCATERFAEFPELVRATLEHRNTCLQRLEELQEP